MPKRIVPGVPDKVENLYYKVLLCPDALRHAKTPKCGRNQNTRYTNEITTLRIIYHQKGLVEEILDHQIKLRTLSKDISEILLKCLFICKVSISVISPCAWRKLSKPIT